MAVCKMAVCKMAVCKMAVCKMAVCKMAVCMTLFFPTIMVIVIFAYICSDLSAAPRAFTGPKKYAEPRRRFRDVVRESKFTYVSQKPLVPHAAGIQREFPTSYRSKAPFGALLVFNLLRYQARYEEHSQPIAGALRCIFRADFWVDGNRGNFWPQPGHRVPPSDLGFSIQSHSLHGLPTHQVNQLFQKSPQVCSASVDVTSTAWYLDSCASHHVCGNREMFCEFEELQPMRLELGEGSSSITGRGTIELIVQVQGAPHEIKLLNVYFVKNFKRNLISIGKIDCAKYHVSIYNNLMKVYKTNSKVCSLYGKLEDGLYRIQGPVKYRQNSHSSLNKSGTRATEPSPTGKPENYSVSVNMWHQRFGHIYTKGLNYLLNNVNVKGIELHQEVSNAICDNCELSKSTRVGFKSESLLVASEPLELLHMDLWGPCPVPSLGEARYLLCVVDDATRYTWIFLCTPKTKYLKPIRSFMCVLNVNQRDKLESQAWKGVMVGYAMGTRGFRIWDPVSNNVYESKHVKFDETRLYKDVVQTHVGDSPFETSVGKNVFSPSLSDTSDTDDEDTTTPRPRLTPTHPPPPIPAPAAQKFGVPTIPPFVSTRKKGVPVSTTSVKSTRVAHRAPVPNKPGWEREEVQRQSGATKGQWDVYYYAPGLRTALRSRPDIKAYCETNLKVKYKADEYDFNPTHAVDSDSDDDVEQPRDAEVEPEVDNGPRAVYL
uniref:MBD domain-containing protein n=1 Tax=Strigamia maritima TaxID=126957 RepID=T1IJE9_STRMM